MAGPDRYVPVRQLGEGGAGRVWLVEDRLRPGSRLALKELAQASRGQEEALRREFATLACLRHPNLVEVHAFDLSPQTGLPRFTLEFVEGKDLVAAVRDEGPGALPALAAEALRALGFLHDFGLVHRDLKPGNLLVRDRPRLGCRLVVLDFGLALRGETSREGPAAGEPAGLGGTLPYLAPELFGGGAADRRSDLYALGAVLYEAVHGRPPYSLQGKDLARFIAVVREGRRSRPALPQGYPPGLSDWLEELLAPDPATRPGDALEVLARLNAACATDFPTETPATRAARLGSGTPAGRETEMKALWDHLESADGPRVVWLAGEAGSGKTRLMRWLASEAVVRSWEVVNLTSGLIAGEEEAVEGEGQASFLRVLRDRAAKHPTVVLLDEAESAPGRVATFVERIAREGKAPPLRVVVALRPADLRQPALRRLFDDTGIVPTLRRVDLGPLGVPGIRAMAERATGSGSVSEARVEWLARASEGNPLVIESLLVEGTWEKGGRGRAEAPSITRSVAGRLGLLTPDGRRWLEALAVLAEPAPEESVDSVAALDLERARQAAGEAATLGLARNSEGSWAVGSRTVAELVRQGIEPERSTRLHHTAAELLAKAGAGASPLQIARLWSGAGEPERAVEAALRAAREAEQGDDWADAAHGYRLALCHLGRRDPRRYTTRFKHAEALHAAGMFDAAARAAAAAVRLAPDIGDRARAMCLHANALAVGGRFDLAGQSAHNALDTAREAGLRGEQGLALKVLGTVLARRGREDEAVPILKEAVALLEEAGDQKRCAETLHNLAMAETTLFLPDALEHSKRAREMARASKYRTLEVYALIGLSGRYWNAGQKQIADEILAEAKSVAVSLHPSAALHIVLERQAYWASEEGHFDLAIDLAREAEDHAIHFGDMTSALNARNTRAEALLECGHPAEAVSILEVFLNDPLPRVEPGRLDFARATLVEALRESPRHDRREAHRLLDEAIADCAKRNAIGPLLSLLVLEMERRADEGGLEPYEPVRQQFDTLVETLGVAPKAELLVRADCARASAFLRAAHWEEARNAAALAVKAADEAGLLLLAAQARCLMGKALTGLGESKEASPVLEQARADLEGAAQKIKDSDLRRDLVARPLYRDLRMKAIESRSSDRRLLALYDMIRALNSEADPNVLLDSILDMALRAVGAERGMVLLRETEGDALGVRVVRNLDDDTEKDAESYSRSIVAQASEGRSILAVDAGSDERFRDLRSVSLYHIRSLMCVPLRSRGTIVGTVYLDSRNRGRVFSSEDLRFVEAFADHAALALENARARARLEIENRRLQVVAEERVQFANIVGRSSGMQRVFDLIEKVAASELPVLIQGESGTGKELVARAIHFHGPRKRKVVLSENCAAIPESLLESALFGHVRGAFTGADRDRPGLFEQADGGTLFLDEVGDMSAAMQARLLRVLEDGELRRVGDERSIRVDVRVLAATHRDLAKRVQEGTFREDLLYRLQVLTIQLPPLRDRPGDLPLLVGHFLGRISKDRGRPAPEVEPQVMDALQRYAWPGNVRQLENTLQRLALLAGDGPITRLVIESDPTLSRAVLGSSADEPVFSLERSERDQIRRALETCGGNRNRAARMLGISRATIYRKIKEHGLR